VRCGNENDGTFQGYLVCASRSNLSKEDVQYHVKEVFDELIEQRGHGAFSLLGRHDRGCKYTKRS
jgi:hypothetical protein